jgi:hypothetical protein
MLLSILISCSAVAALLTMELHEKFLGVILNTINNQFETTLPDSS